MVVVATDVIHSHGHSVLALARRPVEELRVHWRRNGVRLASGLHSFGRRLTISTPTSADTGLYVCEATLRGSAFQPARAQAFLSVVGQPPATPGRPSSGP